MKIDNTDKNAISESAFYVIQMILDTQTDRLTK